MTRSGAGARSLPTCRYFQNLLFLKDKISNKETESNVSLPNESDADSLEHSQQQSFELPNSRPAIMQHPPSLLTTAASSASNQKQVSTTVSTQQQNAGAPLSHTPSNRKCSSDALFSGTPKQKRAAREELSNTIDLLTLKYLDGFNNSEMGLDKSTKSLEEDDPGMLFLKSLHLTLAKLPKRKNRQARIKLQQVLFELEESDDDVS